MGFRIWREFGGQELPRLAKNQLLASDAAAFTRGCCGRTVDDINPALPIRTNIP